MADNALRGVAPKFRRGYPSAQLSVFQDKDLARARHAPDAALSVADEIKDEGGVQIVERDAFQPIPRHAPHSACGAEIYRSVASLGDGADGVEMTLGEVGDMAEIAASLADKEAVVVGAHPQPTAAVLIEDGGALGRKTAPPAGKAQEIGAVVTQEAAVGGDPDVTVGGLEYVVRLVRPQTAP